MGVDVYVYVYVDLLRWGSELSNMGKTKIRVFNTCYAGTVHTR